MDGSPNKTEAAAVPSAAEKSLYSLLTSEVSFLSILSIPERRTTDAKAGVAVVLESVEKIIEGDVEKEERGGYKGEIRDRGGGGSHSSPKLNLLESMMIDCIDTFNNSAQIKKDLLAQGVVSSSSEVFFNLSTSELEKHSCRNGEGGVYTSNGTYSIDTIPTGR